MPVSGCVLPIVIVLSVTPGAELLPPPPPPLLPPPQPAAASASTAPPASRRMWELRMVCLRGGPDGDDLRLRTYLAGRIRLIRRRTDPTMPPGATSMASARRTP